MANLFNQGWNGGWMLWSYSKSCTSNNIDKPSTRYIFLLIRIWNAIIQTASRLKYILKAEINQPINNLKGKAYSTCVHQICYLLWIRNFFAKTNWAKGFLPRFASHKMAKWCMDMTLIYLWTWTWTQTPVFNII